MIHSIFLMTKLKSCKKLIKSKYFYILVTVLFIFFYFSNYLDKTENEKINESSLKTNNVLVEKIFVKPFTKKIILRGYTKSSRIVTLRSQVEGKISVINYTKGLSVKAGKQIVLIDPEDKVAKAKEMEALLEQRKKEYQVAEKLFKNGFRSEVKLSESRTNYENALALFERSQVNLNNTKVIVPFDSFLEDSFVELGDYLKKGDKIVKLVDLDPIFLEASASENEVANLFVGQKGIAIISNGKEIEGKINYISASADDLTRNFLVQLEINNPEKEILSGISGEIHIQQKKIDAFFIPSSVISLNNQGKLGIKIIVAKKVTFLPIKILSDIGTGYWIDSENKKELTIITRGQEYVLDGDLVNENFKD